MPNYQVLAIHELDEGHVGKFSFRQKEGLENIFRVGTPHWLYSARAQAVSCALFCLVVVRRRV